MNIIQKIKELDLTWTIRNMEYRKLVALPLAVAAVIGVFVMIVGVPLGLEFSGGTYLEARDMGDTSDINADEVQRAIERNINATVEVHIFGGRIEIEGSGGGGEPLTDEQLTKLESVLSDFGIEINSWDVRDEMGSAITSIFVERAQYASIVAAVAISIVIFVAFRNWTVIGGILAVIVLDLIGIFGGMVAFDVPLTHASLAGLLLIVGYAIDDNVLLYTRTLKRVGGDIRDRASSAMKTGLTEASTTGIALITLNVVTSSQALYQISAVILMGIAADLLNTWFFNAGLIFRHSLRHGEEGKYSGRI